MKKYKLLKDLPRAKAGSEVVLFPVKDNLEISRINLFQKKGNNSRLSFIHNKDISEWLEEIPQKPKSVWDLKEGDDFFFIFNNSVRKTFITNLEPFRVIYLEEGNAFLTKEEADQELKKIKAIQRIKKYCHDNNIKISNKYNTDTFRYSFEYTIIKDFDDGYIDGFEVDDHGNNASPIGFFEIYADAHKVIENCENDLLIIFNI